jgi:hypothetical protein
MLRDNQLLYLGSIYVLYIPDPDRGVRQGFNNQYHTYIPALPSILLAKHSDKRAHKMTSCAEEIDGKREVREKDTKNDDSDTTHTPVDQGTEILYNAAVNKNGIRLHPQPTADSLDPLNWSSFQKHGILSIVMFK